MIRPNNNELKEIGATTHVHAIKLLVMCDVCDMRWSIFFEDWKDISNNLPENWHQCRKCRNNGWNNGN